VKSLQIFAKAGVGTVVFFLVRGRRWRHVVALWIHVNHVARWRCLCGGRRGRRYVDRIRRGGDLHFLSVINTKDHFRHMATRPCPSGVVAKLLLWVVLPHGAILGGDLVKE